MTVFVCVCGGGDLMFIPWPGQVLISTRPRGFIQLSLFWGLNEEPDTVAGSRKCFNKMKNILLAKCVPFTGRQPFYLNPFFNINQILSFDIILYVFIL